MIVIDTQALVWYFQGDDRLGKRSRRIIDETRENARIAIPAIVTWEIGMLSNKDRISLGVEPNLWFADVLATAGFDLVSMGVSIGIDAGMLPGNIHGDQADRLIIATARAFRAPVLTADEKILRYAESGHVKAIDARH